MVSPIVGSAIIGGLTSMFGASKANKANAAQNQAQREHEIHLARNSIQYRMEDARKAGISPFAAMGISPMNSSGASIPMQNELAGAGNAIASAGRSMQTPTQRQADLLNLQNMKLNNDLLATQVAGAKQALLRANRPTIMPPSHTGDLPGTEITTHKLDGSSGLGANSSVADIRRLAEAAIVTAPNVTGSHPDNPLLTAGHHPMYTHVRTKDGYMVVPSEDIKERIEDSPQEWQHWLRTMVSPEEHKPTYAAREGYKWVFNPLTLTWSEKKIGWSKRYGTQNWNLRFGVR